MPFITNIYVAFTKTIHQAIRHLHESVSMEPVVHLLKGIIVTITRINPIRILAAVAISATLMTGLTSPTWAAAAPGANEQMKQEWTRHRQSMLRARLAKVAERLEIKSSQQGAWQAYARTVESIFDNQTKRPDVNVDAATIARYRADVAADRARKAAQIADATAKLQEVLTPDQRQTFNQIVQRAHHRGHHGERHGQRGDQGDRREHRE
jgi:hypothetical protein